MAGQVTGANGHLAEVHSVMAAGHDQTLNGEKVLLSGASSQIGLFAIPRLLAAGLQVLALSRTGKPRAYPDFGQVRWLDENEATREAIEFHYLLSAGPLALAKNFLGAGRQIRTAVIFSSSSVISKRASENPAERQQTRQMLAAESELQSMVDNCGMKLVIFRPTLVYGCGLDTNITRLAGWIRSYGFMPVNGKAAGLRQPVHADDLAGVAVAALLAQVELPRVLNLSGGSTLSYADMVRKIFAALGKTQRLLPLPEWLFVACLRLVGWLGFAGDINTEMIRRQRQDLVFDDHQARQLLNYSPRPFAPVGTDFSLPDFSTLDCST